MEHIKEAFFKVKQDMDFLKEEISLLREELLETKQSMLEICGILEKISLKKEKGEEFEEKKESTNPTHKLQIPMNQEGSPTHNLSQKPLNTQKTGISTGNEGVPTDRQTDRQTDQQTDKSSYNQEKIPPESPINNAIHFLDSLDNLKKEIRLKFKRLTEQEFIVFSMIYHASEEEGHTDYKNLSKRLNLSESSIRDYVGRLIIKGIPVEKVKVNNKTIHLLISQNLKRIASLSTILQLRSI